MARKKELKKENMALTTLRRMAKNKMAILGLILLIIITVLSILAPYISPYGYEVQDGYNTLAGPSAEHLFGTDNLGRDIFTRVLHGGRASLTIGLLSVLFSGVIGVILGALAGYYGGKVDTVIMRFLDILQAIPAILLAISISAVLGTAFMAGSVFAVTAPAPEIVLSIVLAVPGFLGWILPYFVYRSLVRKRTLRLTPLIEEKYNEIYEICEKGSHLLF